MGYELHITRKKDWSDENGPKITVEDWLAYIATDPQLRLDATSKSYTVRLDMRSKYPDPWLAWFEGDLYTKNPDEQILAKMLQIASVFGAKVQGDDGEIYRTANFEDFFHED